MSLCRVVRTITSTEGFSGLRQGGDLVSSLCQDGMGGMYWVSLQGNTKDGQI